MNKEFIPAYQAFELKFLGFNEDCFGYYHNVLGSDNINLFIEATSKELYTRITIPEDENTHAPTYQQAFKFLQHIPLDRVRIGPYTTISQGPVTLLPLIHYNKYEIHVVPFSTSYTNVNGEEIPYYKPVYKFKGDAKNFEDAQLDCLKKMIQIVRNK